MLPNALNIYNNNRHSTTKFKPSEWFDSKNKNILNEALINLKKSKKKSNEGFKGGTKCLLSENCELKDKNIKYKKFKKNKIFNSLYNNWNSRRKQLYNYLSFRV